MKKLFTFLAVISMTFIVSAQAPQKISYQCVVRNAGGFLMTNQSVGIRISILQATSTGTVVYQETYNPNPQTNANGLVSIEIGGGLPLTGTFSAINWASGPYFLKTETDPTGGINYTISGTSQLLSVPYALHAKTAENLSGGITEADPVFVAHPSNEITGVNISNWNTTYSWGNHAGSYRPISYVPLWSEITNKPTMVAGYGITDAVNTSGNQTIAVNKSFSGTTTVITPVNATDAANKAYVDAILSKLSISGAIVADADGNIYSTVRIGSQVWMGENLKTNKYKDGTAIPLVTDNDAWASLTTPGYCWYNNNEASYKIHYGALYNWHTVNTRKLCPESWHVPTDAEWITLENYLIANGFNYDGTTTGNNIAKSLSSNTLWRSTSITGAVGNTDYPAKRNMTGFTAFAGGNRSPNGSFNNLGYSAYWWSATEDNAVNAWYRSLYFLFSQVDRYYFNKEYGVSVRCLRD